MADGIIENVLDKDIIRAFGGEAEDAGTNDELNYIL